MTDQEFLVYTPFMLFQLQKRKEAQLVQDDFHAALICATLVNVNRGKKAKPVKVEDFMPKRSGQPQAPKRQTPEQMKELARTLNRLFGGTEKKKVRKEPDDKSGR